MTKYVHIVHLSNYSKVLNYIELVKKEYEDNGLIENEHYKIEVYYRVVFENYKVKILLQYEVG
jgi:hypothetical protein